MRAEIIQIQEKFPCLGIVKRGLFIEGISGVQKENNKHVDFGFSFLNLQYYFRVERWEREMEWPWALSRKPYLSNIGSLSQYQKHCHCPLKAQ